MQLAGIQKTTLVDYPGKIAATIFLRGCNFRCGFCHNPELVIPEQFLPLIDEAELFRFLESRLGKLQGVCITGGEPLLWTDTIKLISHIKALGFAVKLDTNGSFPERLAEIIKEGDVDYIAMDIKAPIHKYELVTNSKSQTLNSLPEAAASLQAGKQIPSSNNKIQKNDVIARNEAIFIKKEIAAPADKSIGLAPACRTSMSSVESQAWRNDNNGTMEQFNNKSSNYGKDNSLVSNINKSIKLIMSCGIDYEFRTTVAKPLHAPDDFTQIGQMISGSKRFYLQNYVKSKQINEKINYEPFSDRELKQSLQLIKKYVPNSTIR